MKTSTTTLRTTAALLIGVLLSATALRADDTAAKPATVPAVELFSLRAPVLNDDGSTTLPNGAVIAAPGHMTVNEDGSVTLANGKTLAVPTLNADGTITLGDDTVVEPAKLTVPAPVELRVPSPFTVDGD